MLNPINSRVINIHSKSNYQNDNNNHLCQHLNPIQVLSFNKKNSNTISIDLQNNNKSELNHQNSLHSYEDIFTQIQNIFKQLFDLRLIQHIVMPIKKGLRDQHVKKFSDKMNQLHQMMTNVKIYGKRKMTNQDNTKNNDDVKNIIKNKQRKIQIKNHQKDEVKYFDANQNINVTSSLILKDNTKIINGVDNNNFLKDKIKQNSKNIMASKNSDHPNPQKNRVAPSDINKPDNLLTFIFSNEHLKKIHNCYNQLFFDGSFKYYPKIATLYNLKELKTIDIENWEKLCKEECIQQKEGCCQEKK